MKLPSIKIGRPQRLATLLLLCFLAECLWVVDHQQLSQQDYRYAECGREIWERPSPLAGYYTTCGNIHDGVLAYRAAGLPLTLNLYAERFVDLFRTPAARIFRPAPSGSGAFTDGSSPVGTWDLRHQLPHVLLLPRLPF